MNVVFAETNTDLIFIFDNILENECLETINNYDWNSLNWFRQREHGMIRGYLFRDGDSIFPTFLETLKLIALKNLQTKDNTATIADVYSYYVGFATKNDKMYHQPGIHADCGGPGGRWSCLYHLRGDSSSGPTTFYNNTVNKKIIKSVEFKPNRLIIFPSIYQHQGSIPEDGKERMIINISLWFDTKLNKDILKNSPNLQKEYQKYYINASDDNLLQPL